MNDGGTNHRPEVAIAINQPLWIVTKTARPDGDGDVAGYAMAVGWDRPQGTTFYLVSDPELARPLWIPEEQVVSNSIRPLG
jgi:hypothetical protein